MQSHAEICHDLKNNIFFVIWPRLHNTIQFIVISKVPNHNKCQFKALYITGPLDFAKYQYKLNHIEKPTVPLKKCVKFSGPFMGL